MFRAYTHYRAYKLYHLIMDISSKCRVVKILCSKYNLPYYICLYILNILYNTQPQDCSFIKKCKKCLSLSRLKFEMSSPTEFGIKAPKETNEVGSSELLLCFFYQPLMIPFSLIAK